MLKKEQLNFGENVNIFLKLPNLIFIKNTKFFTFQKYYFWLKKGTFLVFQTAKTKSFTENQSENLSAFLLSFK